MQRTITYDTDVRAKPSAGADLEVVLFYQDFATGICAQECLESGVQGHGRRFRFFWHLWRFAGLQIPRVRDRAVAEAAEADLIIIAGHSGANLFDAVKDWVSLLLSKKDDGSITFAAISDDAEGCGCSSPNILERLSERGRVAAMETLRMGMTRTSTRWPDQPRVRAAHVKAWDGEGRRVSEIASLLEGSRYNETRTKERTLA